MVYVSWESVFAGRAFRTRLFTRYDTRFTNPVGTHHGWVLSIIISYSRRQDQREEERSPEPSISTVGDLNSAACTTSSIRHHQRVVDVRTGR